jgi:hypothetical protein
MFVQDALCSERLSFGRHGQPLLRPYRHAGRTTRHSTAVFRPHKDPVRRRIKRHITVALHKDRKGRCGVGVDLRGHTRTDVRDALSCAWVRFAQKDVSADAVIVPLAPTFTVATAKAPGPLVPGTLTMPSLVVVAAKATISGTGVGDAESGSVFSPVLIGAGLVFVQSKLNCTSVEGIGAVGVKAKTKLCAAPRPMSTRVFGVPVI